MRRQSSPLLLAALAAAAAVAATGGGSHATAAAAHSPPHLPAAARLVAPPGAPLAVAVMLLTYNTGEGASWLAALALRPGANLTAFAVPGLSPASPLLICDTPAAAAAAATVCLCTTDMAQVNAAASVAALVFSPLLDLRATYWLGTGIAGVAPAASTLGGAAWARFLVNFGLQMELDVRDVPASLNWTGGYLGINAQSPDEPPALAYGYELFELDAALLARAVALSSTAALADGGAAAAAYRARYAAGSPAAALPSVVQCDSVTSDTWISGAHLLARAAAWTATLTAGRGAACMVAQEDSAVAEALRRGAAAGRANASRLAVLRVGSDFVSPPPGGDAVENLVQYPAQGGLGAALDNIVAAAAPVLEAIVGDWPRWRSGVPSA